MNAKLHQGWRILWDSVELSFNFYHVSKFETSHYYICDIWKKDIGKNLIGGLPN